MITIKCEGCGSGTMSQLPSDNLTGLVTVEASLCSQCKDADAAKCEGDAYYDGMIAGVRRFAWWKDGVQYVGTCGTTLADGIRGVESERLETREVLWHDGDTP